MPRASEEEAWSSSLETVRDGCTSGRCGYKHGSTYLTQRRDSECSAKELMNSCRLDTPRCAPENIGIGKPTAGFDPQAIVKFYPHRLGGTPVLDLGPSPRTDDATLGLKQYEGEIPANSRAHDQLFKRSHELVGPPLGRHRARLPARRRADRRNRGRGTRANLLCLLAQSDFHASGMKLVQDHTECNQGRLRTHILWGRFAFVPLS